MASRTPNFGPINGDRLPLRFSETDATQYRRAEVFGESNAAVLGDWLGMAESEVQSAAEDGVIE